MKTSASSWSGSVWGISSTFAVCSLTAVAAWALRTRYHHSRPGNVAVRRLWSRPTDPTVRPNEPVISRFVASKQVKCTSSDQVDDNAPSNDCVLESPQVSDASTRRGRFSTVEDTMIADGGSLRVRPIGVVRSVYRLCVGTPRQGLLAPHARARIELYNLNDDRTGVAAAASVDGLQHYSHVWIVFVFHLNTMGKRKISKIAPPALGGSKVGVLATRSPHRLNPIGMTLAKLDAIRTIPPYRSEEGRKKGAVTVLDISGTDLVDGTPILDVKPYVPLYDTASLEECVVPEWVEEGLATLRPVQFSDKAEQDLQSILKNDPEALEFYRLETTIEDLIESVKACIHEVLAIDVRSRHQTGKARQGLSRAEKAERLVNINTPSAPTGSLDANSVFLKESSENLCTQQLDNLLISFEVLEMESVERVESMGSGAEDVVVVQSIRLWKQRE
jgi:tRNA (adenine37-N6)-methyltransferase